MGNKASKQELIIPVASKQELIIPVGDLLPLPHLPHEIIVNILSRLPVKSLLRLRCVCKSWRSLISNPEFAKTHLRLASVNNDYTHHRLLIFSGVTGVKSCSLYSILYQDSDTAVELASPLHETNPYVKILSCCDGLVCIRIQETLFVWNPSTRKSRRLPEANPWPCQTCYWLGYDDSINDYKVVGLYYSVCPEMIGTIDISPSDVSRLDIEVRVYTLRTGSWRKIGDFPCPFIPSQHGSGTFVNRALHWNVNRETKGGIVSLDLVKETYGEVLEPEYRDGRAYNTLRAFNGCLCVLCDYSCIRIDVWVMKEYGVRESWTKLVVVPDVPNSLRFRDITPFWILNNGEVLLHTKSNLVRYNPKDGSFSYPEIYSCSTYFSLYPYVESLVSLDMDHELRQCSSVATPILKGTKELRTRRSDS